MQTDAKQYAADDFIDRTVLVRELGSPHRLSMTRALHHTCMNAQQPEGRDLELAVIDLALRTANSGKSLPMFLPVSGTHLCLWQVTGSARERHLNLSHSHQAPPQFFINLLRPNCEFLKFDQSGIWSTEFRRIYFSRRVSEYLRHLPLTERGHTVERTLGYRSHSVFRSDPALRCYSIGTSAVCILKVVREDNFIDVYHLLRHEVPSHVRRLLHPILDQSLSPPQHPDFHKLFKRRSKKGV